MVLPNLIHPNTIEVERLEKTATAYDVDAREPVRQGTRKTKVTLPGQVLWGSHDGTDPTTIGLRDDESGYVLFRKIDMTAVSYRPQRGDRIIRIGDLTGLKLFITNVIPRGHYPDQGGFTLWQCNFTDRAPNVSD